MLARILILWTEYQDFETLLKFFSDTSENYLHTFFWMWYCFFLFDIVIKDIFVKTC